MILVITQIWSESKLRPNMNLKSPLFSPPSYNHLYQIRVPVKIHPLIHLALSLPITPPTKQGGKVIDSYYN